jgi:phosphoribosylformylglycinamidine synthase
LIEAQQDPIDGVARDGHLALLIGHSDGHLGQSALLAEVFNRTDGDAPSVDLSVERRNGQFILDNRDNIRACTDLSDGGLALAAFEMAEVGDVGVQLETEDCAQLFGEDQARYLVACNFDQAEALMIAAGQLDVAIASIGRFLGQTIKFGSREAPLEEMRAIYTATFYDLFT